jgi:hypothetical protein
MDVPDARSVVRGTLGLGEIGSLAGFTRGSQARREVERVARHWDPEADWIDVLFHEGDLVMDHDYVTDRQPWTAMLVVHGNLVVRGVFEDSADPESVVVVTGDLRAGSVITRGWLEVGGSLAVDGGVLFEDNECSECSAEIFGDLSAGSVFTKYHHVDVHGRVVAPLIVGGSPTIQSPWHYDFIEETDFGLVSRLTPEVLVIEGDLDGEPDEDWGPDHVDPHAVADLLRAGRSPLLRGDTD